MYFLSHSIPISSFTDEFLKFISRGLIFANSHFSKISRAKKFAKSRNLIHAKINPRKVFVLNFGFTEDDLLDLCYESLKENISYW